ncbi:BLIP family protein [Streptomyces katsurahamanus]|uniref:BLIP family protein n=1 Tax=Streptomyces katsurahamanus TaxID=2577098 RepID=A0ABW9NQT2_9ACTN|nr:BLIP family protein [Streptomyces katsurahamanus]MQS35419.1 BLIP family protein [Streptomyces katsurahamanus]
MGRRFGLGAAAVAAVCATVAGVSSPSAVAAENSAGWPPGTMTAAKYNAAQFGMTVTQVFDAIGRDSCDGSSPNFAASTTKYTYLCWGSEPSGDIYAYANLTFTQGKLTGKSQEHLIKPVEPSMTLAKYNSITTGMPVDQAMAIANRNSCVIWSEEYPAYPSTAGHKVWFHCKAGNVLIGYARYSFTDGVLTSKNNVGLV